MSTRLLSVFGLVSLLVFLLWGCSSPQVAQGNRGLDVAIHSSVTDIPFQQSFSLEVRANGLQPSVATTLIFHALGAVTVIDKKITLMPNANGEITYSTNATVHEPGYSEIAAEVTREADTETATLTMLFGDPGAKSLSPQAGATSSTGKAVDPLERYKNVPSTTSTSFHVPYQRKKHIKEHKDDVLPSEILLEKLRYPKIDKSQTEELSSFNFMLPDIGGGTPLPGEIEGKHETKTQVRSQGLGCGSVQKTAIIKYYVNGVSTFAAPGTLVRIFDDNGSLAGLLLIATAFVGNNGLIQFNMPTCDTSSWFDYSQVDLVFQLVLADNNGLQLETWAPWGMVVYTLTTGTFWDGSFNFGLPLIFSSSDAAVLRTFHVWHHSQKAHEFDRYSFGWEYGFTGAFPVRVVFPAVNVPNNSRAAYGVVKIIYDHGLQTGIIYHEMGHEGYYRRMLGYSTYVYHMSQFNQLSTGTFPLCGGCTSHSLWTASGPDAGMLEGWADFFEAIALKSTIGDDSLLKNLETALPGTPTGQNVEGRVAAYLVDWWDVPSDYVIGGVDDDTINLPYSTHGRYQSVGRHFQNGNVLASLSDLWNQKIKPNHTATSNPTLSQHCTILTANTLTGSGFPCP